MDIVILRSACKASKIDKATLPFDRNIVTPCTKTRRAIFAPSKKTRLAAVPIADASLPPWWFDVRLCAVAA